MAQLRRTFQVRILIQQLFRFLIGLLLAAGLLSACNTQPADSEPMLDQRDLLRSLIYVETQLVNSLLKSKQPVLIQEEQPALAMAFCDLVERKRVKLDEPPRYCQLPQIASLQGASQACMNRFHACVSRCVLTHNYCAGCEQRLEACLLPSPVTTSPR